jgi:hypothetical protein
VRCRVLKPSHMCVVFSIVHILLRGEQIQVEEVRLQHSKLAKLNYKHKFRNWFTLRIKFKNLSNGSTTRDLINEMKKSLRGQSHDI